MNSLFLFEHSNFLSITPMPKHLADIIFPMSGDGPYTYLIPPELADKAGVGKRVLASFGKRTLTGFIVAFPDKTNLSTLKPIYDILDTAPSISEEMLSLAKWMSEYYICSLGETLKVMAPSVLLRGSRQYITLITEKPQDDISLLRSAPRQAQIMHYLIQQKKRVSSAQLRKKLGVRSLFSSLQELEKKNLIELQNIITRNDFKPKVEKYLELSAASQTRVAQLIRQYEKRAPKQSALLAFLFGRGKKVAQKEALQITACPLTSLKTLIEKEIIQVTEKVVFRDFYDSLKIEPPPILHLTEHQTVAVNALKQSLSKNEFQTYLLFGITGSGKTQVYIEAIKKTISQGKDAIMLIPEISLTPQTVKRFRANFGHDVAVLHSAMSGGEKYDSWQKIKRGDARVVIGPRSAIFAPLKNIGLVIVDEEHEGSYKQTDMAPRYHARDLAVIRARENQAVAILGSATPSSESYYNARAQKYKLLELPTRANAAPLPIVTILDLSKERRLSGSKDEPVFSRLLTQKIQDRINQKQQTILLLNRRGFSAYIKCKNCDFIAECPHCGINLTLHLAKKQLRCHYCGHSRKAPDVCPDCASQDILFRGFGTQKVENELNAKFPGARTVRMDMDTTSKKRSHDKILDAFGEGKYDILLGTQMVAKGLDFSRVTLVGVINADIGLFLPDFRASERTFQLLTQVAGRAGRHHLKGEVIIQSYVPADICLRAARKHDFLYFYHTEAAGRRELGYPPFGKIFCIRFSGKELELVEKAAEAFTNEMNRYVRSFSVLGPTPSPLEKIKDKFRYQILIKVLRKDWKELPRVRKIITHGQKIHEKNYRSKVGLAIDVDPVSIL